MHDGSDLVAASCFQHIDRVFVAAGAVVHEPEVVVEGDGIEVMCADVDGCGVGGEPAVDHFSDGQVFIQLCDAVHFVVAGFRQRCL